jgi:hypothetical protein
MKKNLVILVLLFCATLGYSQTNRNSNLSTSQFQPITDPAYYRALAKQKQERIANRIYELENLITESLNSNIDNEFRQNIYQVNRYLTKLDEDMSLSDAEWYLNTAVKLYNKSVRKYNKRLKKK